MAGGYRAGPLVKGFFAALLTLAVVTPGHANEYLKDVGNWALNTWEGSSGRVEACYVYADYESGVSLFVYYGPEDGYELFFQNESWALTEGEEYPVNIEIDRFGPWNADLVASASDTVHVYVNEEFISEFKRGYEMRIEGKNQDLYFALTGTTRAIDETLKCVNQYVLQQKSNPFGNSGKKEKKSSNSGSANSRSGPADEAEVRAVMREVVEIILSDQAFSEISYLKDSEYDPLLAGYEMRWLGNDVIGGASMARASVQDQIQGFILNDSQVCEGKFGSAQEDIKIQDDFTVTQLGMICRERDTEWYINYLVLPYDDYSIFVTHLSLDNAGAQDYDRRFLVVLSDWMNE